MIAGRFFLFCSATEGERGIKRKRHCWCKLLAFRESSRACGASIDVVIDPTFAHEVLVSSLVIELRPFAL